MRLRVGIVEDEPFNAAFIGQVLEDLGHSVVFSVGCEKKAMEHLEKSPLVDIIFLDINLKGGFEGVWLGGEIKKFLQIPFIYITAYRDKKTVDKASKTQPFYYLSKPFDAIDIEIVLSIFCDRNNNSHVVNLSDVYRFDLETLMLYKYDEPVKLTQKERYLLHVLVKNIGTTVSMETIIGYVWGDSMVSDSAIRDTVYRIRKKTFGFKIENISSLGYKLTHPS